MTQREFIERKEKSKKCPHCIDFFSIRLCFFNFNKDTVQESPFKINAPLCTDLKECPKDNYVKRMIEEKNIMAKNFGKVNNALGSNAGGVAMGAVGSALDIAKGFVPTQESKGKNPTGFETQQAIGDALTKVPVPIVQAAGLAYKGISMLAEATGGNTNSITKEQAEDIGISKGTRLANNIIAYLF